MKYVYPYLLLLPFLIGCNAVKETSKFKLETGVYNVKYQRAKRAFAVVGEDSIFLHNVVKTKKGWQADTAVAYTILLSKKEGYIEKSIHFTRSSFDFDVLTIVFKYRPYTEGFSNQLNTNFNGAAYIGRRSDAFVLNYDRDALNRYHSRISHFAYSLGIFAGIGATDMNAYVTNNAISSEYDGVVFTEGFAALAGVGNLTFGLALGFDHLLDKNHKTWIYQAKPWLGLTIGLNLN